MLLTSLLHATLPLIRFDLCDHAVLGEAGIGAQTLLAVDGKVPDSLPVRLVDGRVAALEVYELAQLELPGVEKLQFVHHSPAEVEILYQSPDDLDAALEAAFRRLLAQKSATIETVRVRRVERILNDLTTYKLRSVIAPGEPMITPSSLAEADHRVAMPAPAPPVEAAAAVAGDLPASIWPLFSQQAARHPGHPAAIDGDRRLAYGELDQLAAKVAGELQRRDFDARRPVAVLSGHAPDLLPLILGVLRAGGWYVPLDAGLPAGRLQSILADALPQFLLTGAAERAVAATLAAGRCAVLCVDEMSAAPPPAPAAVAPTARPAFCTRPAPPAPRRVSCSVTPPSSSGRRATLPTTASGGRTACRCCSRSPSARAFARSGVRCSAGPRWCSTTSAPAAWQNWRTA